MNATLDLNIRPPKDPRLKAHRTQQVCTIFQRAGISARIDKQGIHAEGELEKLLTAVARIHLALHSRGQTHLATRLEVKTHMEDGPASSALPPQADNPAR